MRSCLRWANKSSIHWASTYAFKPAWACPAVPVYDDWVYDEISVYVYKDWDL